jgi:hypothetical protein
MKNIGFSGIVFLSLFASLIVYELSLPGGFWIKVGILGMVFGGIPVVWYFDQRARHVSDFSPQEPSAKKTSLFRRFIRWISFNPFSGQQRPFVTYDPHAEEHLRQDKEKMKS